MKTGKNGWLLLLLFLFSCSEKEVFYEFHSFKNEEWNRKEAADFTVNITDSLSTYNLDVILRNNSDYPFQNLWLFIDRTDSKGEFLSDTLNVELADVYGKWHGKGLSLYSLTIPYQSGINYSSGGDYVYSIRQGMRTDPIRGISDVGLRISKKTAK